MSHRIQSRRGNGRFQQSTLENTFDLPVLICWKCHALNLWKMGKLRPTRCYNCDEYHAAGEWMQAIIAKEQP